MTAAINREVGIFRQNQSVEGLNTVEGRAGAPKGELVEQTRTSSYEGTTTGQSVDQDKKTTPTNSDTKTNSPGAAPLSNSPGSDGSSSSTPPHLKALSCISTVASESEFRNATNSVQMLMEQRMEQGANTINKGGKFGGPGVGGVKGKFGGPGVGATSTPAKGGSKGSAGGKKGWGEEGLGQGSYPTGPGGKKGWGKGNAGMKQGNVPGFGGRRNSGILKKAEI